jgi:hypothetical protein
MCFRRSEVLHPSPGEFAHGHQIDATFSYFSVIAWIVSGPRGSKGVTLATWSGDLATWSGDARVSAQEITRLLRSSASSFILPDTSLLAGLAFLAPSTWVHNTTGAGCWDLELIFCFVISSEDRAWEHSAVYNAGRLPHGGHAGTIYAACEDLLQYWITEEINNLARYSYKSQLYRLN